MSTQQEVRPAASLQLGIQKYLLFGYMVTGFLVAYLTHNIVEKVWGEGHDGPATAIGAVVGIASVVFITRNQRIKTLAHETIDELAKVTWPTRQETYNASVIVFAATISAALLVFVLDRLLGYGTDLIFR